MSKLFSDIAEACLKDTTKEACGVVVDNRVIPLENNSDEPETSFVISGKDYLKYLPETIYHSHPTGDHSFSDQDLDVAANMGLTSYLYVVEHDRLERYTFETGVQVFKGVLGK